MKKGNSILLKVLGVLLLTAAILKGHELLTVPAANKDIWTNRVFLIFTVEFELAMGIWLLSGLFKRAAWFVTLSCFSLFCCVTFYKGLTGAASCGCFGRVHVNPWITLSLIDLPAVVSLLVFQPGKCRLKDLLKPSELLRPFPSFCRFACVFFLGVNTVAVSTGALIINEPPKATSKYEILEPATWLSKELPILGHIDIGEQLKTGNWLVVLYHYDCPGCAEAIPNIEQMASNLQGNEDFLRIALIAVPPYGDGPVSKNSPCTVGKLDTSKEWFVTTPAAALLENSKVRRSWQDNVPVLEELINIFVPAEKTLTRTSNSERR